MRTSVCVCVWAIVLDYEILRKNLNFVFLLSIRFMFDSSAYDRYAMIIDRVHHSQRSCWLFWIFVSTLDCTLLWAANNILRIQWQMGKCARRTQCTWIFEIIVMHETSNTMYSLEIIGSEHQPRKPYTACRLCVVCSVPCSAKCKGIRGSCDM